MVFSEYPERSLNVDTTVEGANFISRSQDREIWELFCWKVFNCVCTYDSCIHDDHIVVDGGSDDHSVN